MVPLLVFIPFFFQNARVIVFLNTLCPNVYFERFALFGLSNRALR